MKKIITGFGDPIQLEGSFNPTSWCVRVCEINGHREISARNVIDWEEVPYKPAIDLFPNQPSLQQLQDAEDRKAANLKRAVKRAQTMCRRVIKAEGFDEMLTLTYRHNQEDRELCKKHFSIWSKRMKRALGNFRYCASFEKQKRGAMHVHIATHKLPEHANYKGVKVKAWQLGTKIWRDIVGADNGMCFVGGKTKNGGHRRNMSLGKMAAYVSKYILKDYEESPEEKNRYSRSNGTVVPKSKVMYFHGQTMIDIIGLCFQCGDADVIVSHHVDPGNGAYWLCTEPDPDKLALIN
jgi:hypothetical protein